MTLTMTTLILIVALIWAAFFIFIVRFELRNELESLLVMFQCSKRGLRFLGVIGFHIGLLCFVALLVSSAVERSIPITGRSNNKTQPNIMPELSKQFGVIDTNRGNDEEVLDKQEIILRDEEDNLDDNQLVHQSTTATQDIHIFTGEIPPAYQRYNPRQKKIKKDEAGIDRDYLLTVYKIWLTAIVYAFLYLIIENVIMFYVDMTLVEFVHSAFLTIVAKLTGIDLSDYPAGEMLFNPLVRHRIR